MPRILRGAPWLQVAYWASREGAKAFRRLGPDDRNQLRALLTKSKGRYSNLTGGDRDELRRIFRKARGRTE